jgi:hypothetical protein
MVCVGNICINTLQKGAKDDDDDADDYDNNNHSFLTVLGSTLRLTPGCHGGPNKIVTCCPSSQL